MTRKLFAIAIGLTIIFSGGTALADSVTDTADYEVTLIDGCTVDTSAMGLDFGSYFMGDPDLINVGAGSVAITCAPTTLYAWGINKGLNSPGPGNQYLQLRDTGVNTIQYTLTESGNPLGDDGLGAEDFGTGTPTGHADVWGGAYDYRTGTGNGSAQVYNLLSTVLINAAPAAGTYTDQVTVSVYWP